MSKIVHDLSHKMQASTDKSRTTNQSRQTSNTSIGKEAIAISSIAGFGNDLGDKLKKLELETEIEVQKIELSECLMFVAQLVDLFKHTVIASELRTQNEWHSDTRHHLKQHKGITSNRLFDDKIEKIVMNNGLTKDQWRCLLYMSLNTDDTVEITKVSKKDLKNLHDKASRLLEVDEQNAVFALINATEKHMLKEDVIDK
jgi:hypothetical protein